MDEGVQMGFLRVDKDLEALDNHIDRHWDKCKQAQEELCAAEGRIKVLEERSCSQHEMIEALMAHVEDMEGKLCHFKKGKEHEVRGALSPVLGSPIISGQDVNEGSSSDDSYHTPPVAGSTIPPSSSSSGSDEGHTLVLYNSRDSQLMKIHEELIENHSPVPVPRPVLDMAGLACLIMVCGQHAVCSLGHPKSTFHPYPFCCSLGEQNSTHRPSHLCSDLNIPFTTCHV